MAEPATLDPGRAEAASKHVRALNTQFASWVQLQLQNHPLEIWEDGLKDYMSHASEIMDKFKDVVNWLRKNKVGPKGASSPDPHKDVKTTLTAADGSKSVIVQTSSDSGQKVTIVSPSVSQSPNSQNLFSLSSQQKPPALSGTFGDKGTHLVKLANQFPSLVETVAYLVARILLVTVVSLLFSLVQIMAYLVTRAQLVTAVNLLSSLLQIMAFQLQLLHLFFPIQLPKVLA